MGFQESIFNVVRKSVYHRRYHIQNTIFDIRKRNNIQVSTIDENKILETFERIKSELPQIKHKNS